MRLENFYDQLLKSCNVLASLKQIHSSLITWGVFSQNPHLGAQFIIKYAEFGQSNTSLSVFNHLQIDGKPYSFLWNTLLRSYANNGHIIETLVLYSRMRGRGILSNNYTFPYVLKACAAKSLILDGKAVHGDVIRTGFHSNVYVEAALVDMYAKCGQTDDGYKVFDEMSIRDLVSWTSMITAYEQAEKPEKALLLFKEMQQEGFLADSVTIVSVASAVGQLGDSMKGQAVHGYAICNAMLQDLHVGNSLVAMYAKCGSVENMQLVFDWMLERDGITWNSVLSGYTQNGQASEALTLFDEMLESGCKPNSVTALILASACAYLGSRHLGKKLHDTVVARNIKIDTNLQNALMDMYAKCGDLDAAECMFNEMDPDERDITSWNILISGYGVHGHGRKALELFKQMQEEGFEPNHITFTSVLSACSHAGLIDEGRKCFADMKTLSVKPEAKHYACLVDMLGRAGHLCEAFDTIKQMPSQPQDSVWGALLLACRIHDNKELGEIAANNLFELEPEHSGYYVLMSNIYAASNNWQDVGKLRHLMKHKGVKKPAAFSVIENGKDTYGFYTADQVSPYRKEAYTKMESVVFDLKMAGYIPDISCVLHDIEEEDKEQMLYYHSEKLAVAFGLVKIDPGEVIQVTKNLRVCNDCHSAFKIVSYLYQRKIVVRDANRFHHFEYGSCSCNDYW